MSTPHGWIDVDKVKFLPPNPTNKQTKQDLENFKSEVTYFDTFVFVFVFEEVKIFVILLGENSVDTQI